MKPCSRNRKRLAFLVVGDLEPKEARAIRAHLETCEGCRTYLARISEVTRQLSTARTRTDIETRAPFHQSVLRALRAEESMSSWKTVTARVQSAVLNWRVAAPALTAITVAIVSLAAWLWHPGGSVPVSPQMRPALAAASPADPAPTVANYQLVANRSLDELDELLARQAKRHRPFAPLYTASTVGVD